MDQKHGRFDSQGFYDALDAIVGQGTSTGSESQPNPGSVPRP